jgi:hypothetical protein
MSNEEIDEPELIKTLFDDLKGQPLRSFRRRCPGVPDDDGVYIIYGHWEGHVLYVGRTYRGSLRRCPFRRGLRRRLQSHRGKYGRFTGFRYLVVREPRQRALLEA